MEPVQPPTIDEIIEQLQIVLEQEPRLVDILLSCSNGSRIPLWKRSEKAEIVRQMAPGKLYSYLQHKYLNAARARPSGITAKVFQAFINENPGNILPTNIHIPPHVLDNTTRMVSEKLLNKSSTYKQPHSKSGIMTRPYNEVMSFDNIRNEVFSGFVKKIIKKNELVGRDNTTLRVIESKIHSDPLTDDEMYTLIWEHVMSEYIKQASSITTSGQLLAFISKELDVLSALVSDFYPSYLGMIDVAVYNTYSGLLTKYIELILQKYRPVGNSRKIAESIKSIVSAHICPFFQVVGDPDPATRQTMIYDIKKCIIDGARIHLSQYSFQAQDAAGAGAAQGGNRRRIKKYKNRTSRRSSRRTSRRTSRVTKYRTNRYKIKNKKTRKIR